MLNHKLIIDIGYIFGELEVLYRSKNNESRTPTYKCRCSCGKKIEVEGPRLLSGERWCCGCKSKSIAIPDKDRRNVYMLKDILGCNTRIAKAYYNKMSTSEAAEDYDKYWRSKGCILEIDGDTYAFGFIVLEFNSRVGYNTKGKLLHYHKCKCPCGRIKYIEQATFDFSRTATKCQCLNVKRQKPYEEGIIGKPTIRGNGKYNRMVCSTGPDEEGKCKHYVEECLVDLCDPQIRTPTRYREFHKCFEIQNDDVSVLSGALLNWV